MTNKNSSTKVFLSNLPNTIKEPELRKVGEEFGVVKTVKLIKKQSKNNGPGGVICFRNKSSASRLLKKERVNIGEEMIILHTQADFYAIQNAQKEEALKKLYIGGFCKNLQTADIKSIFSVFGQVLEVKLNLDPTSGESRGSGFVSFAHLESARLALEHNQKEIFNYRFVILSSVSKKQSVQGSATRLQSSNKRNTYSGHTNAWPENITFSTGNALVGRYNLGILTPHHTEAQIRFNRSARPGYQKGSNALPQRKDSLEVSTGCSDSSRDRWQPPSPPKSQQTPLSTNYNYF